VDNAIGVWAIGDPMIRYKVPAPSETGLVGFIGSERLVTTGRGNAIKIWQLATGKVEQTLLGHTEKITSLTVSADLRTLASGSAGGELKLWDVRIGLELASFRRHGGPVRAADFSGDGRYLLTGGADPAGRGEIAYWEASKDQ
jgi:WD40 repeat protein